MKAGAGVWEEVGSHGLEEVAAKGWICSANFLGCFLGAPQESARMRGPGAMRGAEGTAGEFLSAVAVLGVSRSFSYGCYIHPFAAQPSAAFKTMLRVLRQNLQPSCLSATKISPLPLDQLSKLSWPS